MEENNGSRIEILLLRFGCIWIGWEQQVTSRLRVQLYWPCGSLCSTSEYLQSSIWPWAGFLKSIVGLIQGSPSQSAGAMPCLVWRLQSYNWFKKIWCLPENKTMISLAKGFFPTLWRPSLHLTFVSHSLSPSLASWWRWLADPVKQHVWHPWTDLLLGYWCGSSLSGIMRLSVKKWKGSP